MLLSINMTTRALSPPPNLSSTFTLQLPTRCLPPFSIFTSCTSYSSSLPGDPLHAFRQSLRLYLVSLVLSVSRTQVPFLTVVSRAHPRCNPS